MFLTTGILGAGGWKF